MPNTGEKPGRGTYVCEECQSTVEIHDNNSQLPPCPKCNGTRFEKQERGRSGGQQRQQNR
ncbi:MAG: zinc ribbon-containing protein [Chloroflexota bacterium]